MSNNLLKDIIHENIVLKTGVLILSNLYNSLYDIGQNLLSYGADDITEAGFWIWDYETDEFYYSPKFIHTLGYNSYEEFPNVSDSFKNAMTEESLKNAMDNVNAKLQEKSEELFYNKTTYKTKDGENIDIICTITVLYRNSKPIILLGTHKKINN